MSAIINGDSPSVTFSDGTTQATSAIVSGKVPYTNLPAGSVLQVVNAANNTGTSASTSTYVDTGLSATITPKYTSSKILVIANMTDCERQNGTGVYGKFAIFRDSTNILEFAAEAGYSNTAGGSLSFAVGSSWLDSPATTSAITYKIRFGSQTNNAAIQVNASGKYSTITLMEIAG